MKEIVVATNNQGKVAELKMALQGLPVMLLSLQEFPGVPEAVEDSDTFLGNAFLKARHYMRYTGRACLADDSGLVADALHGAPGVYSARYAGEQGSDWDNNQKLIAEMTGITPDKRTARFRCELAFCDVNGTELSASGACEGYILEERQGQGGFGYDPLFYVPSLGKTMAELSMTEKNAISHRGQAVRDMAEKLRVYLA